MKLIDKAMETSCIKEQFPEYNSDYIIDVLCPMDIEDEFCEENSLCFKNGYGNDCTECWNQPIEE